MMLSMSSQHAKAIISASPFFLLTDDCALQDSPSRNKGKGKKETLILGRSLFSAARQIPFLRPSDARHRRGQEMSSTYVIRAL